MQEYLIDVSKVEDLQTTKDLTELDLIFSRAHSTVNQGGTVILTRDNPDGTSYNVNEISTEIDLKEYKEQVYKYL